MGMSQKLFRIAHRLIEGLLSVPIFFKIFGIGTLVAMIFACVTFYVIDMGTSSHHHKALVSKAHATGYSLAESISEPVVTDDLFSVKRVLERTVRLTPELRYVVVRNYRGQVVAHTFTRSVPADILSVFVQREKHHDYVEALDCGEEIIYDIVVPILDGRAGTLQVGITDTRLQGERILLVGLVLGAVGISSAGGITCTLLLTHLLTRPILHLRQTAEKIRLGDYGARATVYSRDEVGELALTINRVAQSLEQYHYEVKEKELARTHLIRRIVEAQEDERQNLARELHDQLGQSISKALLTFQGARKGCGCCDSKCIELEGELRGLIDETRRMAWNMRPPVLDDFGLDSALERYVQEISARLGIPIEYECVFPAEASRLPCEIELTLYRITQEALTNVIRHAKARHVSVVLCWRNSLVTLVVEDDGCGFDTKLQEHSQASSLGLVGIRERASLIGGEVEIQSEPGGGTEVLISIPLKEVHDVH